MVTDRPCSNGSRCAPINPHPSPPVDGYRLHPALFYTVIVRFRVLLPCADRDRSTTTRPPFLSPLCRFFYRGIITSCACFLFFFFYIRISSGLDRTVVIFFSLPHCRVLNVVRLTSIHGRRANVFINRLCKARCRTRVCLRVLDVPTPCPPSPPQIAVKCQVARTSSK